MTRNLSIRFFSTLITFLFGLSCFSTMVLPSMAAVAAERTGKQVVDAVCISCHGTGENGAPRVGDVSAWQPRASQGLSSLTRHALEGIRNMPAHGGAPNLSDADIARAITYMVNQSGGNWVEPVTNQQLGGKRTGEQVVQARCASCHANGEGGAPRIGVIAEWAPRVKQGIPYLVGSAIHGHGGMPPRGGQANLTDAELQSAIMYMLNPKSAHPEKYKTTVPQETRNDPNHRVVDDMELYFGLVPVSRIRSLPASAPEHSMHGGIPNGPGYYHVNVSLFDNESKLPVTDAKLRLEVACPGSAIQLVELTPMFFSGAGSYGNYVKPETGMSCGMTLHILRASRHESAVEKFEHRFD